LVNGREGGCWLAPFAGIFPCKSSSSPFSSAEKEANDDEEEEEGDDVVQHKIGRERRGGCDRRKGEKVRLPNATWK
jgi:hypothetical protein